MASHAEGAVTTASGIHSHAEGNGTTASGTGAHAEGNNSIASAQSHAEGYNTTASHTGAHAEGYGTTASGAMAHAEGNATTAFRDMESIRGLGGYIQQSLLPHSTNSAGQTAVSYVAATGIVTIPIHAGITRGRIALLTESGTISWDIIFSASNAATTYATRGNGTVTVLASSGTSTPTLGSSSITWTVSGNTTGQVILTPSTVPAALRVWCELLQLGSTTQTKPA
jgi:hypothetical protein